MSFGATPLDGSVPPIPMSSVVPDGTNTPLALEGGPAVVTGGNTLAPVSIYAKDGNDLTQGAKGDSAATDSTSAWSVVALLKGLYAKLAGTLTVGGSVSVSNLPGTQPVSGTVTANQGGTWTITNVSGTVSLPTGAATAAKQPALGTAGTPSADVLTVQGTTSMTPMKVDGSAVAQPVTGTFWQATQPVSAAALPLPAGAAQEAGHLATIDTSTAAVNTTTGAKADSAATDNTSSWSVIALLKGMLGKLLTSIAVTQSGTWTVQPGNTANTTAWKVDGSAVTQPVSGTVTLGAGAAVVGHVIADSGSTTAVTSLPALPTGSNTIGAVTQASGPWTEVPNAATTGGSTPSHTMSAASTNATVLKNAAGQVYGISISNANAAARYFKLYNKASAPTVGTDIPVLTIQVPANGTVIRAYPVGLALGTGIAWATTTGIADADTGAVGANDLSIDLDYK